MSGATAFQSNGFQNSAFQVTVGLTSGDFGARLTGGSFSKGKWRTLKEEIRAERALKRKRKEDQEAAKEAAERVAAFLAAQDLEHRAYKRKTKAEPKPEIRPAPIVGKPNASSALLRIAQNWAHERRLRLLLEAKRQEAEDDETMQALLLADDD